MSEWWKPGQAVADYRCVECGHLWRDMPETREQIEVRCCVKEPNDDVLEKSIARRVWTPPSIGAVKGAGGSPAR